MVNSFIAKKDLDSEMTVVRNEFEIGENNPFGVLADAHDGRRRFSGTTTASHTIGARSDIENVPIDRAAGVLQKLLPARQRGVA